MTSDAGPPRPPSTVRASDGTVHGGRVPSSEGGARLLELVRVMAMLRAPGGCPWDREQTHQTLARHLLEETHELLDAIDRDDPDSIRDELGDLLLQVVFHAEVSAEAGGWDVDDVARGLVEKLVRRHPHVFGDVEVSGAQEVLTNWEKLKAEEAGARQGVEEDIPASLPALARAAKVLRRAAGWGVERRGAAAAVEALRQQVETLASEPAEAEGRIGDVLFAAVAAARELGVDPETALRRTTRSFAERFERLMAGGERDLEPRSISQEQIRGLFGDRSED